MRHLIYTQEPQSSYPVCIVVPTINGSDIKKAYVADNFDEKDVLVVDLFYNQGTKKTTAAQMKEYIINELVPVWKENGVKYIIISDSAYFKILTKVAKVDAYLGYALDTEYGDFKVAYVPSYKAIFYDPIKIKPMIKQGIDAVMAEMAGIYKPPGTDIIKFARYPKSIEDIEQALIDLLEMEKPLTIDTETFDLKHPTAGIGTISFSWDKHSGIAFAVDYCPIEGATEAPYGYEKRNDPVRKLLKAFFIELAHKAIYHNIAFDVYNLIYQLFMVDILDTEGLLTGIDVMLRDWDDTKLISYLATNSCAGNKLGLKDQSQEFAGNYAIEEIKDIRNIPLDVLLTYNLVDALATWYVHEKRYPMMVTDDQLHIYETVFKPATVDIIQMQLTGLPISMTRVKEVKAILQADNDAALQTIMSSDIVREFTYRMNEEWVAHKNATLKKKRVTLADAKEEFNPNSSQQLQELLYVVLALPIIAYTGTKQASTDGDTLKALLNHTHDPKIKESIGALIAYKNVDKILTSFIPAMEKATLGPDGWHYLFGNFNLGGTVSGRLSSSNPNLQNLPANSKYAKLIKSCVVAPPGFIFAGLDFASLEDRISALTTKDPNKLKVYTDGYDGHCLRATAYFGESMSDIELAPAGAECYTANVGGTDIYFHSEEDVEYLGTNIKGKELYALITNSQL